MLISTLWRYSLKFSFKVFILILYLYYLTQFMYWKKRAWDIFKIKYPVFIALSLHKFFGTLSVFHLDNFLFLLIFWVSPAACGISQARGSKWSCSCSPIPQPQKYGIPATSATYTIAHGNAESFNSLSEARDQALVFMDTSWALYRSAIIGTPCHNRNSLS